MKNKILLLLIGITAYSMSLFAQDRKVSGIVKGKSDQELIIGANVLIKGTKRGTVTNVNGKFAIYVGQSDKELEISYVGMKRKIVKLEANKTSYMIELEEDYNSLDDVVVIGYGTQAKRDIIGSITTISSKDLDSNSGGNINTALQGKIPGMQIVSTSGEPGAGSSIKIRGASSINGGSEPLYIVDGVPIESENISSIDGDATFSPIAGINPSDIESIEVLKDASSAAIYGSRAANGIVMITTKGGNKFEKSKPIVTVSHTSSVVSISRKLDAMNAEQFRTAYKEARANNNQVAEQGWIVNPFHPYYNRTTDWQDVIFRTAYQTRNDVSVRGGSDSFSYGVSAGYRDLKPVVINTKYNQINLRANFLYKVGKRITAGTKVSFSNMDYTRILSSGSNNYSALRAALFTNPCFSPYDPLTGEVVDWLGVKEQRNPLAVATKVPIHFKRRWLTMNQYIQINLTKGLNLRVSVSGDISKTNQDSFMPKEFDSNTPARDNGKFRQSESQSFLNENTLSYNGKIKSHHLNVVLGQSFQQDRTEAIVLNGNGYIDKSVITIQNASTYTNISRSESERALLSFFGRVSYDWKGRYLASATLRSDGSSRFGKNKRFGTFPSASIGWRFSDEKFMNFAKKILRDAKFRASVGVTGNQTISNYASLGSYTASSNKYDGNVEILYNAMPNDIIGWEKTTQYNIGLDLSFFNGRVVFNADAYLKKTNDLLFDFPVPNYTGFSSVPRNYGSVENKGLEFLLETVNLTGKFKWKTSFNISMNRNKITELPNNEDIIIGDFSLGRVGEPMGVFYAHKALGVYSKDEDNVYILPNGQKDQVRKGASTGAPFKGGDMIWEDIDGNGVIDDNDRVIIGDPNPKFIGGMSNTFSYKGVSLNIMMQWSYGNKIMNELRRTRNAMRTTSNLGQDALARWKAQGDITNFPMIRYQDKMENFRPSSFNMEDGSFLRIKEITLSYNIPPKWCKKVFLKSANVYISGTNLLTWSKYSGYDPEVNTSTSPFIQGVDNGAFPKSRSYNLGVNFTF